MASLGHSQWAQLPLPLLPHPVNPVVLLSRKSLLVPASTDFPQQPEYLLISYLQPVRPSGTWVW